MPVKRPLIRKPTNFSRGSKSYKLKPEDHCECTNGDMMENLLHELQSTIAEAEACRKAHRKNTREYRFWTGYITAIEDVKRRVKKEGE